MYPRTAHAHANKPPEQPGHEYGSPDETARCGSAVRPNGATDRKYGKLLLSSREPIRPSNETLDAKDEEQERLFRLIASLANCLDRRMAIETVQHFLRIDPIEIGNCVFFDDIAVGFNASGRVNSLYRVIDGTTKPVQSGIQKE
jgi:hypothetical protein